MRRLLGRRFGLWLGVLLSLALVVLLMVRVPLSEVGRALNGVSAWFLLPAMGLATLNVLLRGVRWSLLFPSSAPLGARHAFAPAAISLAVNGLVPGRLGDVARIVMTAKRHRLDAAMVATTVFVDRLFDAVVLLALLVLAASLLGDLAGTHDLSLVVVRLALVCGVLGAAMLAFVSHRVRAALLRRLSEARRLPQRVRDGAGPILDGIGAGLSGLREPKRVMLALGCSLFVWVPLVVANWVVGQGFADLHLSLAEASVFTALTVAATFLPSAPGAFGVFEAAGVLALRVSGACEDEATGLAFSLVAHASTYVTVVTVGLVALFGSGLRWRDVVRGPDQVP